MAGYMILDGDGTAVYLSKGLGTAIMRAKEMLHEETLRRRKPEAFVTDDGKSAMVGFWHDEETFEPYYFVRRFA